MRILIFGAGRVGRSMAAYAAHLGHEVDLVGRAACANDLPAIRAKVAAAGLIAAAIPDAELAQWGAEWRAWIGPGRAIHFSGAQRIDGLLSYHPLYSFPLEPLAPQKTAAIAIAREAGAPRFAEVLPGAANPEFEIAPKDRAFYHALAVLSGNFAAHLFNETARAFAQRLRLEPRDILGHYLDSVVERFRESPYDSLTGPVVRRDEATVAANLASLAGEPRLSALYKAFLASAWPDHGGRPELPTR
jgi:predicted short-subunit dehydrogenase-like oxidoreductase (DUF2520 family)